jgi:hypothetical protein
MRQKCKKLDFIEKVKKKFHITIIAMENFSLGRNEANQEILQNYIKN